MTSHPEPVNVFETANVTEAEIIKGMLEADDIPCEISGVAQAGFSGVIPEVTLMVRAHDAERARDLIANHRGIDAQDEENG